MGGRTLIRIAKIPAMNSFKSFPHQRSVIVSAVFCAVGGMIHTQISFSQQRRRYRSPCSLFYAWKRGANAWEFDERRKFANDTRNLFAVENAQIEKNASGPTE